MVKKFGNKRIPPPSTSEYYTEVGPTRYEVVKIPAGTYKFNVIFPAETNMAAPDRYIITHVGFSFFAEGLIAYEHITCDNHVYNYTCHIDNPASGWYCVLLRKPGPLPYATGSQFTVELDLSRIRPLPVHQHPSICEEDRPHGTNYIVAYYTPCTFVADALVEGRRDQPSVRINSSGTGFTVVDPL